MTKPRNSGDAPKKRGRPFGVPNPNGGRPQLPEPEQKSHQITIRFRPDLYAYLKSLPPGSIEKILQEHYNQSLIV